MVVKIIKNRNKKLIIAIIVILLMILSCTCILAYFTATDEKNNEWIIGFVNVQAKEIYNPPKEITPGISFVKEVSAENDGRNSAYIRFRVVFSDGHMENMSYLDFNTVDYVYEEGYWYLKEDIDAGEVSSSLFTTVNINESANVNEIKDYDILIYLEAYQADGFKTYKEAWAEYQKNRPAN